MGIVGWAVMLAVAAWVAAPWVSMARRGTVDARTLATCSREQIIPAPRRAPEAHGSRPEVRTGRR